MVFSRHHLPETEFKILAVGLLLVFIVTSSTGHGRGFMLRSTEELTTDLDGKVASLVSGVS